jgi:hypothetical protein
MEQLFYGIMLAAEDRSINKSRIKNIPFVPYGDKAHKAHEMTEQS